MLLVYCRIDLDTNPKLLQVKLVLVRKILLITEINLFKKTHLWPSLSFKFVEHLRCNIVGLQLLILEFPKKPVSRVDNIKFLPLAHNCKKIVLKW